MRTRNVLAALLLLLSATAALAQGASDATYSYTGPNFDDVMGSYTTANRITGQFTTATPLGANFGGDVSSLLTSFSFSDGVQTLDDGNSVVVNFQITTGSDGNITTYGITVYAAPATASPINGMDMYYSPSGSEQDDGFVGAPCSSFGGVGGICDLVVFTDGPNYGQRFVFPAGASAPGTWTFAPGMSAAPQIVPALSPLGLLFMALVLAAAGLVVTRNRIEG